VSYLSLLVEACLTGLVHGLGPGCLPDDVEQALGPGYLDDWDKKRRYLRRDYGLLEFHFTRADGWTCRTLGLQVHRLAADAAGLVPAAIERAYGPFPRRVRLDDLRETIEAGGHGFPRADTAQSGYTRFFFTEAGAEVFAVAEGTGHGAGSLMHGDVWSVVITAREAGVRLSTP
jgi:hypothetical protein